MSRSSSRRWRRGPVIAGLLTLLYACFVVAPFVLMLEEHRLHKDIARYLSFQDNAALYRAKIEVNDAVATLQRARALDPEVGVPEVQLTFDVLYQRQETLTNVARTSLLSSQVGFAQTVEALRSAVALADQLLHRLPGHVPASTAELLLDALKPAEAGVNGLMRDFTIASAERRDALRLRIDELDERVHLSMELLLVASPLFLGGLIFINYRLGRANARYRQLSEELRHTNAQLTALLTHAPARISIKDTAGRYLVANRASQEFHRLSEPDMLGRQTREISVTPGVRQSVQMERQVLQIGMPLHRQIKHQRGEETAWYLEIKFPIRSDDDEIMGVGSIGIDVTEEKRIQEELVQTREAAVAADRAKTHFLANMSHELRTPLNAVIGFAEVIEAQMLGPDARQQYIEYAGDIRRSARHLLALISQILDFARIEGGFRQLAPEPIAPSEVAETAARAIAPLAQEREVALQLRDNGAPSTIEADPQAMLQVLTNLLSNAVKFSPSGGTVVLTLSAAVGGGVDIVVADHGIGIAKGDPQRLFTPFTQLSDASAHPCDGIGLGLIITKALVELHGGSLSIESAPQQGTTVTVHLPSAAADRWPRVESAELACSAT